MAAVAMLSKLCLASNATVLTVAAEGDKGVLRQGRSVISAEEEGIEGL